MAIKQIVTSLTEVVACTVLCSSTKIVLFTELANGREVLYEGGKFVVMSVDGEVFSATSSADPYLRHDDKRQELRVEKENEFKAETNSDDLFS